MFYGKIWNKENSSKARGYKIRQLQKLVLQKYNGRAWNEFKLFRVRSSGELFETR
jgi:hypothetical protein